MKTLLGALTSATLLLATTTTFAASTVDLTVKGLIVPSACTPSLSSGGVIDHGKISAKDLNPDNPTMIGLHTLTMAVVCEGQTLIALQSEDNRKGSSISNGDYGLGLINGTEKLGHYHIRVINPIADGVAVQSIASINGQDNWFLEKFWDPTLYMSVADMSDPTQPVPVQELLLDLEVDTTINRTDRLDLSNEVQIDGSATLTVMYL
ncbi:DUF1120 domain-containing protein [Pseudomonas synxantha]|uniref:Beta-fimbriae probable major subunit n=1 Tax=Pseudomonas synxantha TaxID=47883 RepID=A0AAU8TZS8_9PSED|nr:DUF1120 domain-containing protein [Pseudomonas synxantha]AKA84640.1 Beta-fimbriae probable major subunit [Pseudomonas synxantha]